VFRPTAALCALLLLGACAREAPEPAMAEAAPSAAAPVSETSAAVPLPPDAPRVVAGPTEPLEIVTAQGPVRFKVEIADSESERSQGLMWRGSMPADTGMIFDYGQNLELSPQTGRGFWMRNTYIPLDIIFIGPDGRIQSIARNTTPLSESMIFAGGGPVRAILEINGGLSERLGILPGDRIRHRIFP
jgi:uncharacterized membrane protein (UPF0127 family)